MLKYRGVLAQNAGRKASRGQGTFPQFLFDSWCFASPQLQFSSDGNDMMSSGPLGICFQVLGNVIVATIF